MSDIIVGIHEFLNRTFPFRMAGYQKILSYNNLKSIRLNINNPDFWDKLNSINYFIYRWGQWDSEAQIGRTILPVIENIYKIRCFPDQSTCWHYDDKIKQYFLLKAYDFPAIKTFVFWDKKSAIEWIESASFPIVFKLKCGASSANVVLLRRKSEARKIIKRMFSVIGVSSHKIPSENNLAGKIDGKLHDFKKHIGLMLGIFGINDINPYWQRQRDYVLFQEFMPDNKFDIRVTVIGNRAFSFLRHVRPDDFRASGSGDIDYDIEKIDMRCLKIAFEISEMFKFQSMAYDFIFNSSGEPEISEMSYTFVDDVVYKCPGYFDRDFRWNEGHFWPQFCHLQDFISEVRLEQPPESFMLE